MLLTPTAPATGGSPASTTMPTTKSATAAPPYSAVVSKTATMYPQLTPVLLANQPSTFVDNIPAILFTNAEEEQLRKQRENTLIMKFARHVTLHMSSTADTKRALAFTTNKIKKTSFPPLPVDTGF